MARRFSGGQDEDGIQCPVGAKELILEKNVVSSQKAIFVAGVDKIDLALFLFKGINRSRMDVPEK